jgi:hypothetical protein
LEGEAASAAHVTRVQGRRDRRPAAGGDGDAGVEDRHPRRRVHVPAGREGQRLEGDIVVPGAQDVAGPQQLGGGAPREEQVARDHAVDEQHADHRVDVAELLVRLPRAGLEDV